MVEAGDGKLAMRVKTGASVRGSGESPEITKSPGRPVATRLLATSAFIAAFASVMASDPRSARAACAGENSANVTCDAANPATAGTLNTTFAGTTLVNVNPGSPPAPPLRQYRRPGA